MKRINSIVLALMALLTIVSCEKEIGKENLGEDLIQGQEMERTVTYNLLDYTPNVYHDYFSYSDHTIGFSAIKLDPLKTHFNSQRNLINDKADFEIKINKFEVAGKGGSSKMSKEEIDNIYGKELSIDIVLSNGKTFKNGETKKDISMYVPKKINISNPKVEDEGDVMPYCYYDGFLLEWNADPKNEEGLVVVAEYFGATAIPKDNIEPTIINTDIIDMDNGTVILDNDLWEGIPNTAVVYLSLLRGNVQLEEVDGKIVKFYAETHAELPIILIKDLDVIQLEQ